MKRTFTLKQKNPIKDALMQVWICLEYNPPTNSSINSSSLPLSCHPTHIYCRNSLIPPVLLQRNTCIKRFKSPHWCTIYGEVHCASSLHFLVCLWKSCKIVPARQVIINCTLAFTMSGTLHCDAWLTGQVKVLLEFSLAASPSSLIKLSNRKSDSMSTLWITLLERLVLISRTKDMPALQLYVETLPI